MRIEEEDEDEDEDEVEGEVAEDDGGEKEEFALKARRVPELGGRRDLGWRGFP